MKGPFKLLSILLISMIFTCNLRAQKSNISTHCFNGNAQDGSGNGNHGTVVGATLTTDRNGKPNSAYFFDGVNDYIQLATTPYLLNNYTYSLWLNPGSIPSSSASTLDRYSSLLSIGSLSGDQQILLSNNPSLNHVGLGAGSYHTSGPPVRTLNGILPNVNQWYHLTYTRSNDYIKLYINGGIVDSFKVTGFKPLYGTPVVASLGARRGNAQFFHGKLDDLRIYNYALSSKEVSNVYKMYSCGDTISVGLSEVTSNSKNEILIYPNPATDFVNIKLLQQFNNVAVRVHGISGVLVHEEFFGNTENIKLNMPFSEGIYVVSILDGNELIYQHKILKK